MRGVRLRGQPIFLLYVALSVDEEPPTNAKVNALVKEPPRGVKSLKAHPVRVEGEGLTLVKLNRLCRLKLNLWTSIKGELAALMHPCYPLGGSVGVNALRLLSLKA